MLPKPSVPVDVAPFSEGAVLFWAGGERVWFVNECAATVWHLIKSNSGRAEVLAIIAGAFSLTPEQAEQNLDIALGGFAAEGLLQGGCPQMADTRAEVDGVLERRVAMPHVEPDKWEYERCFGAAATVCMRSQQPSVAARFALLYAHVLQSLAARGAHLEISVLRQGANGWICGVNGYSCTPVVPERFLLPVLTTILFRQVVDNLHDCMLFHAAVMVRDGVAFLFPAPSGRGKTTLSAVLAADGWQLFSDELAAVSLVDHSVVAVPLPLSVKSGAVDHLAAIYPDLPDQQEWLRPDGKRIRYLSLDSDTILPLATAAPVGSIVFPHYCADGTDELVPVSKTETLRQLCLSGSSQRVLTFADVQAIVAVVERADCYRMSYTSSEAALRLLGGVEK